MHAKHYNPAYAIKKADIDSFLSASMSAKAALPLLGRQGEVLDRGCVERVEVLVHRAEALDPSVGVDYFATKLFNSVLLSSMNHMSPGMLEGHRTEQLPVRATPSAARRTLVPM